MRRGDLHRRHAVRLRAYPPVEINAAKQNKILGLFSQAKTVAETRPRFWVVQANLDIPLATDLNKQVEIFLKPD